MKKITWTIVLFFLFSCTKEKVPNLCLKIKVIGYGYCAPATMGAQILEGPQIGDTFGAYNNVISIKGISLNQFSINSTIYLQVRDVKSSDDFSGICLAIYPDPSFSKVVKVFVSSSDRPCGN